MISLSAGCCGDSCNQHSYELGYETNRASAFGSFGKPNGPGTACSYSGGGMGEGRDPFAFGL